MAASTTAHDEPTAPLLITVRPYYLKRARLAVTLGPILLWSIFVLLAATTGGWQWIILSVLLLLASVTYWIGSISVVDTSEMATVTVFERPADEVLDGWYFHPLWITEVERYPRAFRQEHFPGKPEMINKVPDEEAQRMGSKLMEPIRILSGPSDPSLPADDPLNERYSFEPIITVLFQFQFDWRNLAEDGGLFEATVNIPGKHWYEKYESILEILREEAEQVLNEVISAHSASWVNDHKAELVKLVKKSLVKKTKHWGISILSVNVLGLEFDHSVNKEISGVIQSRLNLRQTVIDAQGEKERLSIVAEGEKKKRILNAEAHERELAAEGAGLRKAADALGVSGDTYFAGHVATKTFGEGDLVVAPSLADAVTGGMMKKVFEKKGKETNDE